MALIRRIRRFITWYIATFAASAVGLYVLLLLFGLGWLFALVITVLSAGPLATFAFWLMIDVLDWIGDAEEGMHRDAEDREARRLLDDVNRRSD